MTEQKQPAKKPKQSVSHETFEEETLATIKLYEKASGNKLDGWQKEQIDGFFKTKAQHFYSLCVPRQNGKTELVCAIALFFFVNKKNVLYTAHLDDTAQSIHDRLLVLITALKITPFSDRARGIIRSKDKRNGAIFVRTRTAVRGIGEVFAAIINDEAQYYNFRHLKALEPTISTSKHASTFLVGTAPDLTDSNTGEIFLNELKKVKQKKARGKIYGVEKFKVLPTAKDWAIANPAYPNRLTDAYFEKMLAGSLESFNYDQLGLVELDTSAQTKSIFPPKLVNAMRTDKPKKVYEYCVIKLTAESGKVVVIGACENLGHIELRLLAVGSFALGLSWLEKLFLTIDSTKITVVDSPIFQEQIFKVLQNAGESGKRVRKITTTEFVSSATAFCALAEAGVLKTDQQEIIDAMNTAELEEVRKRYTVLRSFENQEKTAILQALALATLTAQTDML